MSSGTESDPEGSATREQAHAAEDETRSLESFAELFGMPIAEFRFGARPVVEPPWTEPLDRATFPRGFAPDDPRYRVWLHATLADLAEHFSQAFFQADMRQDAGAARLRSVARILRATALLDAAADDTGLERIAEPAGRFLRAAAERQEHHALPTLSLAANLQSQHRVATRLYADQYSCDPPFVVPAADVGATPLETKAWLRQLMRTFLVRYQNPGPDLTWRRRIAGEMSDAFVAALSLQRSLVDACKRPTDEQAVQDALTEKLLETPHSTTREEFASGAGHAPGVDLGDAYAEVLRRELAAIDDFAEELVCVALRALGFPGARGFYDYERKRVKKQAGV